MRAEPYFIKRVEDYNGVALEEHRHRVEEVISPDTAGKMVFMLEQVPLHGTAATAVHAAGEGFKTADGREDRHDQRFHRQLVRGIHPAE